MAQSIVNEPVVAGNPALSVENLPAMSYRDHPVITTRALAGLYGTDQVNIRKNLSANKDRFIPGKHFFKIEGQELRSFRECVTFGNAYAVPQKGGVLTLWTARGAARHAKMLDTDKAWDVFELLEESYFHRQSAPAPTTGTLTPSQQQEIKELVQAKASVFPDAVKPKVFSQIWTRVQRKFKVPRYTELPVALFGEARDYVIGMQVRDIAPEPLPEAAPVERPALPIHVTGMDREIEWRLSRMRAAKHEMMEHSMVIYQEIQKGVRPKMGPLGSMSHAHLVQLSYGTDELFYSLDRSLNAIEHLGRAAVLVAGSSAP